MTKAYTQNYTDYNTKNWAKWLSAFAHQPYARGLEVGSFEGRSSRWFLDNILTGSEARLYCVDYQFNKQFVSSCIESNAAQKVIAYKMPSDVALRSMAESFHFAYIDGNHAAHNVLEDAVLAFGLLLPGGIMIFDDYRWVSKTPANPRSMPALAIDAFLSVYGDVITVVDKGYQVCLRKK